MKVLLIDTAYIEYSREFANALRNNADTTVIRKYYTGDSLAIPVFYKYSEKMKRGKVRQILRAIEYFFGYCWVLNFVKKNHFDVIHIQWPQILILDRFFFKKIKKYTNKLVYTAHDVIPHEPSSKKIKSFGKIYQIPDIIIVHGLFCKNEFQKYYPDLVDKIYIQRHGAAKTSANPLEVSLYEKHKKLMHLKDKIVFSFIGQISPYKGVDILLDAWNNFSDNEKLFLLIAGRTTYDSVEIHNKIDKAKNYKNAYIFNERYSDDEEYFFYNISDVVVLPYRTASMSGVFFTAAKYNKTILTTKVGCLTEYIEPLKKSVFTCNCDNNSIKNAIQIIVDNYSKQQLKQIGTDFAEQVQKLYSWNTIVKNVVEKCYMIGCKK